MRSSAKETRIGLLGGSFDPVHKAHIDLALAACQQWQLDHVELIPAGQPWQKQSLRTPAPDRLAMLKLAVQGHPQLHINTVEIDRTGPSYTVDTVLDLPPDHNYLWIMGSDQLQNFTTWKDWQTIVQQVQLAVAKRPTFPLQAPLALLDALPADRPILTIDFVETPISSTQVRSRRQQHQPLSDYLDPQVIAYIQAHNLYSD